MNTAAAAQTVVGETAQINEDLSGHTLLCPVNTSAMELAAVQQQDGERFAGDSASSFFHRHVRGTTVLKYTVAIGPYDVKRQDSAYQVSPQCGRLRVCSMCLLLFADA